MEGEQETVPSFRMVPIPMILSDLAKYSMTRSIARSLRQPSFLFKLYKYTNKQLNTIRVVVKYEDRKYNHFHFKI